ncbi:putative enzyme related to lactoylglutathione lyase [Pedobacter sp. UYP30]|uniref:VOC family protein n=1 Tax=Pedobacter sp. UYP30 TaxID=1756400 RepID=UPI0033992104
METKNPIVWFEINVDDMSRAKKFYEEVLKISLNPLGNPNDESMEMWAFPSDMEGVGASGTLVKMNGVAAGGNSTTVYFRSEDCAIEERRIVAAGGKVFRPKESLGQYGFMCLGMDTEGNIFGLHSMA